LVVTPAQAGPIPPDTFLQFASSQAGIPATGCDPADPAGPFCFSSSGTPTSPLDAPPWTFTGPGLLTVTDVFESGDQFQLFDFGVSLGLTSVPGTSDCGDDPVPCLADPAMSKGTFALGAGPHSLTLTAVLAPTDSATGYLIVTLPEPGTLSLSVLFGVAAFVSGTRKRSRR
jgi:hypothetical protein